MENPLGNADLWYVVSAVLGSVLTFLGGKLANRNKPVDPNVNPFPLPSPSPVNDGLAPLRSALLSIYSAKVASANGDQLRVMLAEVVK